MEMLIEAVKQHPCLWQMNSIDYKDANKKCRSWEILSVQLNKPVDVLKKEWKSLRDGLRQAMRAKKSRSGLATDNVKLWRFEKQLEFLKPYLTARTLDSTSNEEDTTAQSDEPENFRIKEEIISVPEITCPYRQPTNLVINPLFNTRKRQNIMSAITQSDTEHHVKLNKNSEQSDDLLLFFKSIYESTRKMPIMYQIHVKRQLMDIILAAQEEIILQSMCNAPSSNNKGETSK